MAGSNFNLANSRLAMQIMPSMGRNHFFALFSVITSLGLGAAPVLWGVSLDSIGSFEITTDWFTWRRHSFYFVAIFLINLAVLGQVRNLREVSMPPGELEPLYSRLKRATRNWFH
jgi:hypothetical protein